MSKKIQKWWAENPMTYGSEHGETEYNGKKFKMGSKSFFDQVDKEFYLWNKPLHHEKPFDKLFPYIEYKGKEVLEIGCGLGTMLMNWAKNESICTAIDLNPTSVKQTKTRFNLYKLKASIDLGDANKLIFDNNTFDYVYSWGVLHHSSNIDKSIKELFRVLKPGGGFGIMLYNRNSIYQWYMTDYVEGFLHNERQWLSSLELNSRYGDGHREEGNPYTWPITKEEGVSFISPFSEDVKIRTLGTDLDSTFRLILPGVGKYIPKFLKKPWARRFGWSLWFYGHKSY